MTRERLPNRRPNATLSFEFEGETYHLTMGFYLDGRVGEVFVHGSKVGSAMDLLLSDICTLLSIAQQYGVPIGAFAHSMSELPDGSRASVVGAIVDRLAAEDWLREKLEGRA